MRQHDLHRGLRHALMAEEVQLEAFLQRRFIDLADAALPGGAGVGDDDIDAAECPDDLREGVAHGGCIRDVACHRERRAASGFGLFGGLGKIDIEQRDLGAGIGKRLGGRRPDRATRAGDDSDLARQRLFRILAELGLFDRPIFGVEHVGFGDRLEAADGFGIGDDLDRSFSELGRDAGVLGGAAEPVKAKARHQHHAGQGIEHPLAAADARVMAREILLVAFGISLGGIVRASLEAIELAGLGRG